MISRLILALLSLTGFLVLAMSWRNAGNFAGGALNVAAFFVAPAILGAGGLLCQFLGAAARQSVIITVVCLGTGLLGADAYLGRAGHEGHPRAAPGQPSFDTRNRMEVIRDLRAQGVKAYPTYFHGLHETLGKAIPAAELIPLAGISGVHTVFCNESGQFIRFDTDEYGFNNPRGLWSSPVDFLALGDSFTEGACVEPKDNIVGQLGPALGKGLNLGISSGGPAEYLAATVEYGRKLRPNLVLWFQYEGNDLSPFQDTPAGELERRYMHDGYTQDLMARQGEISRWQADAFDKLLTMPPSAIGAEVKTAPTAFLRDVLLLRHLRRLFHVVFAKPNIDYARFQSVLRKTKAEVEGWGGRLIVVYLPEWRPNGHWSGGKLHWAGQYEATLAAIKALDLPVIDMLSVFAAQPDPTSLFAFSGGHYNERGYGLVARTLAEQQKTPPSPSFIK